MVTFRSLYLLMNKEFRSSMTFIYGIGKYKAFYLASRLALAFPLKLFKFNFYRMKFLGVLLQNYVKEKVKLERVVMTNIFRLIDSGAYKGKRHKDNLPCRGQRTRTNASTRKRNRFLKFI